MVDGREWRPTVAPRPPDPPGSTIVHVALALGLVLAAVSAPLMMIGIADSRSSSSFAPRPGRAALRARCRVATGRPRRRGPRPATRDRPEAGRGRGRDPPGARRGALPALPDLRLTALTRSGDEHATGRRATSGRRPARRPLVSPAAFAPLVEVRTLGGEGRVVAVTGVGHALLAAVADVWRPALLQDVEKHEPQRVAQGRRCNLGRGSAKTPRED